MNTLKIKEWNKGVTYSNHKKIGVVILIFDEIDLKTKMLVEIKMNIL